MTQYSFIILRSDGSAVDQRGTIVAHDRDHALLQLGAMYYTLDERRIFLQPNPEVQYAPKEVEITWG